MTHVTAQRTSPQHHELSALVTTIGDAVARGGGWPAVAVRVGEALTDGLPAEALRLPDPSAGSSDGVVTHRQHVDRAGAFSLVALVCEAGRSTSIHDHVTWCVFAVVAGELVEERFALEPGGLALHAAGETRLGPGAVRGEAPPGDIHRLTNVGTTTAISLHVYGTDTDRVGSSVRRAYDLPVLPSRHDHAPPNPETTA